ncbi:hypothetical protein Taro_008885, partial [Colocasia esculenta]|nr:hypothetical protein [Colocasia esculenta]
METVEGVPTLLAAPLLLGCVLWLLCVWPCVPVLCARDAELSRTVCCCSGESFSQDHFVLVSVVVVLPQSLRCAVGLAGAFWRVFSQSGALVVLVEVLPGPACVASAVLLVAVFSLMVFVLWSWGLCILVKVLPRIALCRFWWTFFPGVLCVRFGPLLSCPCDSKCAVWLGRILVRFSQDGSWRFLVEVLPKAASCCFVCLGVLGQGVVRLAVRLAAALASLSRCSFLSFSAALEGPACPRGSD